MEKIIYENNNYFVGENGVYMEMQNIKIYKYTDGIKRFLVELKDSKKISSIKKLISKKGRTSRLAVRGLWKRKSLFLRYD